MPDTRANAIALLVERLREIEAEANNTWKREDAWFEAAPQRPTHTPTQELLDHIDNRDLNYALAYRCEQLIERIEAALLFEELDNAEKLAENNKLPRPGDRVRITGKSPHLGDLGTLIAFGPMAHDVLLDKDRNLGSGGIRLFAPEELVWLKPEGAESEAV